MDRIIVYPGGIPLDTDLLSTNRNAMVALGYLAQAALGSGTVVDGLACLPTSPASLTVNVGPGSIAQMTVLDANPYGSLGADTTDPLVKVGINTGTTSFTLAAPTTSGQSINYLIQATLLESDVNPVVLPYYNAANPAQPFSGPNNTGTPQNTERSQRASLQLKAGAPAITGTQTTPPVDNGWVGLYVVTVNFGQSQITAAGIATLPTAPFIAFKLNTLRPGFASTEAFTASGTFTVPAGVTRCKVTVVGGGGGGAGATLTQPGGAGGAGGAAIKFLSGLTPGQTVPVTIGAGGAGGGGGGSAGNGGSSSFGTFCSATGGAGGIFQLASSPGGAGGAGAGGDVNLSGGCGGDGFGANGAMVAAPVGGASLFGGGGRAAAGFSAAFQNGQAPGSGAGPGYGVNPLGGQGAPGLVMVEY